MEAMSLSAYARRRGVSHVAVSKAVACGRLSASVGRDERGRPTITDPELADREWNANTRTRADRPSPPRRTPNEVDRCTPVQASGLGRPRSTAIEETQAIPDYNASRARKEAALADMAELDLAERRGELVPADAARADVIDRYAVIRTRLLGIPSSVAQRMPHVAAEIVPVIDALLREALEELAVDGGTP